MSLRRRYGQPRSVVSFIVNGNVPVEGCYMPFISDYFYKYRSCHRNENRPYMLEDMSNETRRICNVDIASLLRCLSAILYDLMAWWHRDTFRDDQNHRFIAGWH
jgi:hypothetical protein